MARNYIVYDNNTGRILRSMSGPVSFINENIKPGQSFIEGIADFYDHYVSGSPPAITDRPNCIITIDKIELDVELGEIATISNIPVGTKIEINGIQSQDVVVSDGTLEIEPECTGEIIVSADPFPMKRFWAVINAS